MALKYVFQPAGWTPPGAPEPEPPPDPGEGLIVFSNPKVDFIIGPQVAASDTDAEGNYVQTSRVPWPWFNTNSLIQEMTEAGYYLSVMQPGAPGDIAVAWGRAEENAIAGAVRVAVNPTFKGTAVKAGRQVYFENGASADVEALLTHCTVTFDAPGLSGAVADGEAWTGSVGGAAGEAEAAAASGAVSLALFFTNAAAAKAPKVGHTLTFSGGATAVVASVTINSYSIAFLAPGLSDAVALDEGWSVNEDYGAPSLPWERIANSTTYRGYLYYYDLGLSFWQNFYSSGDTHWRDAALLATDVWWKWQYRNGDGTRADPGSIIYPRSQNLAGLLLTAIYEDETLTGAAPDGTSLKWDLIYEDQRRKWHAQIYNKFNGGGRSVGVRDPGYTLLYAAMIAGTLPDVYYASWAHDDKVPGQQFTDGAAKRAEWVPEIANIIKGQPGGVLGVDGHFACYQELEGPILYGGEGGAQAATAISQPWHMGLMCEGFIQTVKLFEEQHPGQYDAEVSDGVDFCERVARYMWLYYNKPGVERSAIPNEPGVEWRTLSYDTHDLYASFNFHIGGTIALTPDGVGGTTALVGDGTLFQSEGFFPNARLLFRDVLPGTMAFNADGTVVGDVNTLFTNLLPGAILYCEMPNGDHTRAQVATITDDQNLTLTHAPGSGPDNITPSIDILGAGRTAWQSPFYPISGTVTVTGTGTTRTLEGDLNTLFTTELQVGELLLARSNEGWGDTWIVEAITDDNTATVRNVSDTNPGGGVQTWTGARVMCRYPRDGEARGWFTVQSVADETHMTVTPDYPLADLTGRVVWITFAGSRVVRNPVANNISGARQTILECPHVFGFMYSRTSDETWLTYGDEMFAAAWGNGQGPGADEYKAAQELYFNLASRSGVETIGRGKEYNQGQRSSGRYLAFSLAGR